MISSCQSYPFASLGIAPASATESEHKINDLARVRTISNAAATTAKDRRKCLDRLSPHGFQTFETIQTFYRGPWHRRIIRRVPLSRSIRDAKAPQWRGESPQNVTDYKISRSRLHCWRRFALIPQPTEWQRIGNQIEAAMIFGRTQFWSAAVLCRFSASASIAKCYCLRLKSNR